MKIRLLAGLAACFVFFGVLSACGHGVACADTLDLITPSPSPRPPSPSPYKPPPVRSPGPKPPSPKPPAAKQPPPKQPPPKPGSKTPTPKSNTPSKSTTKTNSQGKPIPKKFASTDTKAKPPKSVPTRPKGMDPKTPSAPTKRTSFGSSYRNPTTHRVYVIHASSYYTSPLYWGLHSADYLYDPYFHGGFYLGHYYPANYLNPLSMWYLHPIYYGQSCQQRSSDFPADEKPDPVPVNVNITNEVNKETETTSSTLPPDTSTTSTTLMTG